jgi:hypothetical protein
MSKTFFICNQSFTFNGKRVRRYEAGKRYTEAKVADLPSATISRRFTKVTKNDVSPRHDWATDEYLSIVESYHAHFNEVTGSPDYDLIYADHSEMYPDRLFNSVKKQVYVIQGRDTRCPQVGLSSCARELAEGLNAYDSERYPLSELEILAGKALTQLQRG